MGGTGLWLGVATVFVVAGMVKGVVGLGLPTVSMALLALWVNPSTAAAWLVVPSWRMLAFTTGITLLTILFGSLYRIASLGGGAEF